MPHRFYIAGIVLPIVIVFGIISNLISIFIFTRPEMRTPLNLIITGKDVIFIISRKMKSILYLDESFEHIL